nr:immunoglobulin light chain junction region [Macaca mulatta]
CQQYNNPPWTF